MRTPLVIRLVVSLAIAGGSLAHAQAPTETVDSLLAMSPAPGVEALLLAHANDVRVVRRWMELLDSPNADLRLSSARAFGVTNLKSAAPGLLRALANEQEPAVVSELLRAIAVVAPDGDIAQIYAHMDRVASEPRAQIVEILSATRPALVATHIRTAPALRATSEAVSTAYARIARAQPAIANTIDTAPEVLGDATVLTGILQGAAVARRALPVSLIDAGLRYGFPVRAETLAYVVAVHGNPKAARAAYGTITLPAAAAGEPGAEERWMRALEQRWLTGQDAGRLAPLITTLPDARWIQRTHTSVLGVLRADERKAYGQRFALPDPPPHALRDVAILATSPTPVPAMTLLSGLPAVMLADVIRVTGCTPGSGDEQFAVLQLRADGRPAAVGLARGPWSPGCERAAHAAVAMSYSVPPLALTDQTNALVRLDAEFVTCLTTRRAHPIETADDGDSANITPPTKVRNVPPVYPADAVNARVQGVVIVEARIEPSGCVSEARVVRPVRPSLDAAAMQAVTRWRYSPTLLRGVPVPLVMTTTVNFALR